MDKTCNFVKVGYIADQFRDKIVNSFTSLAILFLILLMMQADFMKMPFPDNTFDAVYAIEATCHAPDAVCIRNSNNYNLGLLDTSTSTSY